MLSSSEIRQQFVDFFCKKHGHTNIASSPVVPLNDPTLLFANAGMNQFKPYFLGTEKPPVVRVANTQKCIRAGGKHNDLDDVGRDTYHHTFFEMLGNWSFGDYFKKDAIAWAWELLTEVWKLDPTRLHVTVFEGDPANGIPRDDEAAGFWKAVGVPEERIHLGNKKDNFWEMGNTGPCGPCTEIHIDRTPDKSGGPLVNGGTDKVIEIWNLVFIQFNRNEDQSLTPLPAQHVDTGMGFERICSVVQGKSSNYDTDVFTPLFEAIQKVTLCDRPYGGDLNDLKDTAYRVIADHIRTLTFALTDGATIGNVGRDYVLKRILRRAERYGYQVLGTNEPFLYRLVDTVVEHFGAAFPELKKNPHKVKDQIRDEEAAFLRTLRRGITLFNRIAAQMKDEGRTQVSGKEAFKLHDTYGVIIDITLQMAQEQGLTVDVPGFEEEMKIAQDGARAGGKKFAVTAVKGDLPPTDDAPKYDAAVVDATVLGWVVDNEVVRTGALKAGDSAALLLDRTNFYAEQGGQVGDTGTIDRPGTAGAEFEVEDTQRLGETVLHVGALLAGELKVGDRVTLQQTTTRRIDVMRNHTATHLLNLALREVLGHHVEQKGSLVDEEKTRFDFSHDKPVTAEELREIERRVNRQVVLDQVVTAQTMPLAQAKGLPGVRAVFGEKYPDPVRVVMIGAEAPEKVTQDMSVEFCGGTHLPRTGTIGYFKIVSQEGVAKGIRRITAVTGKPAYEDVQTRSAIVDELAGTFQCRPDELPTRVGALQEQLKAAQAQLKKAVAAALTGVVDELIASAPDVGGSKVVVAKLPDGASNETVRTQIDRVKQKCGSAFVVFGWSEGPESAFLIAALTPDLVKKGLKAGDVVKQVAPVIGGGGGGKPEQAQAGGKEPAKLPEALQKADRLGRDLLAK
ncbi:Alanine--tRNA ligase [Gemmata obscuriglobus]|uniref:Alanine--tRNA ligase n=1 Tax=Gemmata obscuriglobus TaxID=114 RepID=A0A2Z3GW02_9BACT|nr:alanine--tRNA ligase [Gemmata obscuriglobus]AWM35817.1 alanine--tRNA ligase [Gemmata obscuriglobus]QEG31641.1 Alanine--tRNA ligase [Gemmata obscuriglobus]VTS10986.1 alanine--trna ligase-like : Alanine--tRNA ligase OS=Schizophyllum commune (strain H4-8 / FGSC 9210) GN=ALA1 PE=3 SV=1: tRNA-synt_2c: tRNA_SAD: DHHA1 [Gemmata obscuriglobus UQM 2246]